MGMADLAILTVFAFVSLYLFLFLVFILWVFLVVWNMSFVLLFVKHFSANLAVNIFLLDLRVGMLSIESASLYGYFLLSIRFTAIFCTLSMSFSFFLDRLEPQTTQDCSTLFLMNNFYIWSLSLVHLVKFFICLSNSILAYPLLSSTQKWSKIAVRKKSLFLGHKCPWLCCAEGHHAVWRKWMKRVAALFTTFRGRVRGCGCWR